MNHEFTPVILIHLGAAFAALVLGSAVFLPQRLLGHVLWSSFGLI